ncbi:MAG: hypothetical protein IJY63_03010 [Clostridia bacterium]|nr:hypothetical protein [Clostridia bacterium]MBQ8876501.1 hypothetical protein [Clostridia bacterium]
MKKVVKFLPVIAAVLGLVAVISLFLPAIVLESGDKFPGFTTVFGYDKNVSGMKIPMLGFSFMNLLTYVLVIVGIVVAVLTYLGKGGKFMTWIAVACLLVAGIFFFCVRAFATVEYEPLKAVWSLGFGAILAGICSILGALSLATSKLLNK